MNSLKHANQLLQAGELRQAQQAYKAILQQQPQQGDAHFGLAKLYLQTEQFDLAIAHLRSCCELQANNIHALLCLADAFEIVNAHQDSATVYQYLLSRFASSPFVCYKCAVYYSQTGQFLLAEQHVKACIEQIQSMDIKLHELLAHAYLLLVKLSTDTHTELQLEHIISLRNAARSEPNSQMIYDYVSGDILAALGRHKEAFEAWSKANKQQFSQCDVALESICDFFQLIKKNKLSAVVKEHAKVSKQHNFKEMSFTPIFIVGLARTGSTLLEQIICQQDNVQTLGEQAIVSDHVAAYFSHKYQCPYPDFLAFLSPEDCQKGQAIYMQALQKRQLDAAFVVDKLPANFQSLGLIKAIFPYAKIINLQRNINDVAISTFKHYFDANEPYFCDLPSLQKYHSAYTDLMDYWQNEVCINCLNVNYEALITDHKKIVSKILAFCGLSQDDTCKIGYKPINGKFNQVGKPIQTLSALQVRAALSTAPLSRANPYQRYLYMFANDK